MKKLLLSVIALAAMSLSAFAETKTVTIDFSAQGYTDKQDFDGKSVDFGGGLTIAWSVGSGSTHPQYFANGTAMRLYGGNTATFSASGDITKIVFTYSGTSNAAKTDNSKVSTGAYDYDAQTWTGAAKEVTLSNTASSGHFRIQKVEVTYDAAAAEPTTGSFDDLYVPLKYDGVNYTVRDEWANAVIDNANGKSEVSFSTSNIDFIAVGGTTPKDVEVEPGSAFPGWINGYNDVAWNNKSQNLDDAKTRYYAYIVGTGNPVVETTAEEIFTDDISTGRWRAAYVYYGPETGEFNGKNYKKELPQQGLYYQFTAKKDGHLKIAVWSNKGKRNTFVIDKETMSPVEFTCEGYYNGQNEADPKNEGKNQKKWLTNDAFVTLHDNAFKRVAKTDPETGETVKDADGNVVYEACEDTYPYVLGDGNQNFWGYLNMDLKAGQTYLLFQDSSQIGFGGFQFTDGKVAEGDLFSATATVFLPEGISKAESVTYNGDETFTSAAGATVTITFTTLCSEYTLTGIKGNITPAKGWEVKSSENGTVTIAAVGETEPKYAVSFTTEGAETFSVANNTVDGIQVVKDDAAAAAPRKVLENGRILIGNYNIAGQRVK